MAPLRQEVRRAGNKVANFFFGDHSLSRRARPTSRARSRFNYPDGPKPDGPARQARRAAPPARTVTVTATPAGVPAGSQALVAAPPPPVSSAAPASGTQRVEIKVGMSADEVRKILGDPQAEMVFGEKTRWTYPALTVMFVKGKVTDVQF